MSNLNIEVQATMAQCAERMKNLFPELEFMYLVMPFAKADMQGLSAEQRAELEKRCVNAASKAFRDYLKNPEEMKV